MIISASESNLFSSPVCASHRRVPQEIDLPDVLLLGRTWAQWRMVNSLLIATVLRIVLIVISYGAKVPAGIFVPSMAVGATFGRMVGILVKATYR